MTDKPFRAGIVGCGTIAKSHLKACNALKDKMVLNGVTDINPDAARDMSARADNVRCFASAAEMTASGEIDGLIICTPPAAHEETAIAALEAGVHVLCEKPLAHSVESGKCIMEAATRSKAVLMTAFRHRFLPAVIRTRELFADEDMGPIVFFHNTFCGPAFGMKDTWFAKKAVSGGGTMMDTSAHSVDLFRFIVGEVIEQKAVMHTHLEGTDVEDASIMALKSETGAIGMLTASWVAGSGQADIRVMGQNGLVVFDYTDFEGEHQNIHIHRKGKDEVVERVPRSDGVKEEVSNWIDAINGKSKLFCDGNDGMRALEIIQGCYAE